MPRAGDSGSLRPRVHLVDSLISFAEARAQVLASAFRLPGEDVALADARTRVLTASVASPVNLPPFDTSAMDGYAVRVDDLRDLPARLPLAGTVYAGDPLPSPLPPGSTVGTMTGAPLPDGADGIVPVEWATQDDDEVVVERAPALHQFIRWSGSALSEGDVVAVAGSTVTPAVIGLAASLGLSELRVSRQPRVAIVSTGDELVTPGTPLRPGQIWDSNGPGLAAHVLAAGGLVDGPHRARDTRASVASVMDATSEADVLVIAGGVSMGERDLIRPELEARGVEWQFWGVRQRPGKPFAFGLLDGRPVFGLPGNPVSATVGFEIYVRPLLDSMLGRPTPPPLPARLRQPVPKPAGLHTFARVTAERDPSGILWLSSAGPQGSHVARTLSHSDGLAHLPEDWSEAPEGAEVEFTPWPW